LGIFSNFLGREEMHQFIFLFKLFDSFNAYHNIPGRIGTDDAALLLQPIVVFQGPLFGWQERQNSVQGIQEKMSVSRNVKTTAAQNEIIARL